MSYYKQHIQGLCPELQEWQVDMICDMLDTRDKETAAEKRNTEVEKISGSAVLKQFFCYQQAMECYFGQSRCFEALEQYRAENP